MKDLKNYSTKEIVELINKLPKDDREDIVKLVNEAYEEKYVKPNLALIEEAGGNTVYNYNNIYIAIQPDSGRNFHLDPYFKISWQPNFNDNSRVCRISMRITPDHKYPRYIYHINDGAKLGKNIDLNKLLREPTTCKKYDTTKIDVWTALMYSISEICNIKFEEVKKLLPNIPDYSYIEEDPSRHPTKWGK